MITRDLFSAVGGSLLAAACHCDAAAIRVTPRRLASAELAVDDRGVKVHQLEIEVLLGKLYTQLYICQSSPTRGNQAHAKI